MINYHLIAQSIDYYADCGFKRIESPWTVTEPVSSITKPEGKKEFKLVHHDGKVLVASGEQSFLYLYLKGFLPKGAYQTVTPCFRDEAFDNLHTKYFIKNELIDTGDVTTRRLDRIVEIAESFFVNIAKFPSGDIKIKGDGLTGLQYDIEYKGIELGSYGIRSCDYLEWIYATGCAEPRTSSVYNKFHILDKSEKDRMNAV